MAEPTVRLPAAPRPAEGGAAPRPATAVRYFEKPAITLYRMGREVATLSGVHGSFDPRTGEVRVHGGRAEAGGQVVEAAEISLLPGINRIEARGGVRIEEDGVTVTGDRASAPPSLAGVRPSGRIHLLAKDRAAADAVLTSRLV